MEQEILRDTIRDTIYVVQSAASSGNGNINIEEILHLTLRQLTPIIMVCTIAVLSFILLRSLLKVWHEERMATIGKGVQPKPEPEQSAGMPKAIRWGAILTGIGVGGAIDVMRGDKGFLLFLPFLFLGISWIAYHFLHEEKNSKPQE
jgi:hypothetical protein